jgi:hypothetical protein
VTEAERSFAFVQFDLPGRLGIEDGRYPVRHGDRIEHVLVVASAEAPPPVRGRRRRRPRPAHPNPEPPVPFTRLTVIESEPLGDVGDATTWLAEASRDSERSERRIQAALAIVNRAVHAQRSAGHDPSLADVSTARALAIRLGHGSGDQVAEGRWTEAIDVAPGSHRRQRRTEALRPSERVAAVLGGRDRIDACEALLLRARADLDAGRTREAALQLRVGLDALLAELPGRAGPDQEEDLATLEAAAQSGVAAAARAALDGDLSSAHAEAIAETLGVCERVLRRRRILGPG